MRKLSEKVHHQFIIGKINGAIFDFMQKIAVDVNDSDALIFDSHIKNLVSWKAQSERDCKEYFHIYANAPVALQKIVNYKVTSNISDTLCKYAFFNRNKYNFTNAHSFTKVALDYCKEIIKNAHPNNMGIESENPIRNPYNIDKWVETMRYIY
jgi:hypothetical protein